MEIRDFFITPVYIFLILGLAYFIRPKVTNQKTRKYFFPAIGLKMLGAIALGLIYQFYYGGGDTFGFTLYGSALIWEAFLEDPVAALKLIFASNELRPDTFAYASRIWYFDDAPTYFVVRVAGFFSLITANAYSAIAIIFACISFIGLWSMYNSFERIYPHLSKPLAYAIFFIPSTIFWGSGVLKDTLTLAALALATTSVINIFIFNQKKNQSIVMLIVCLYVIYVIKIYILLCFAPAVIIWLFFTKIKQVKSKVLRILIGPLTITIALGISFFGIVWIGSLNEKYSVSSVLKTAEITAKDNSLWTVRKEGSGYNLGDYDFSPQGIARKFIPAVWVTLFRPYPWEARSVVMLLSAVESFLLIILFFLTFFKGGLGKALSKISSDPVLVFCFVFTISFAFAIGISSGNFGSLVRYKIPIIPYFLIALFVIRGGRTNKPKEA